MLIKIVRQYNERRGGHRNPDPRGFFRRCWKGTPDPKSGSFTIRDASNLRILKQYEDPRSYRFSYQRRTPSRCRLSLSLCRLSLCLQSEQVKSEHAYIYYQIRCMQQGLNLRCSIRRTDYESVAFDHSAMHAVAILSIKTLNCKNLKDRKWHTATVDKFKN